MSARARWSWTAVVMVVLVGLGAGCPEEFPEKPQLRVIIDPNPFAFDPQFVGVSRQSSIALTNKGLEDLVINSVTLSGDNCFHRYSPSDGTSNPTLVADAGTVPSGAITVIPANKSSYYSILFNPTSAGTFSGNVSIQSNAENTPSKDIPVSGTAEAP
ncbi:MAG TPA: hypothetical protein VIG99_06520 [Myxococcaceae bacterium]